MSVGRIEHDVRRLTHPSGLLPLKDAHPLFLAPSLCARIHGPAPGRTFVHDLTPRKPLLDRRHDDEQFWSLARS